MIALKSIWGCLLPAPTRHQRSDMALEVTLYESQGRMDVI